MSQAMAPVELENLWVGFGEQLVHQEINLSVGCESRWHWSAAPVAANPRCCVTC